jgi:signal transduction histidine kinase
MLVGMDDRTHPSAERVEAAFAALAGTSRELTTEALARARARVNGLLSPDPRTDWFGLATLAGSALSSLWIDAGWTRVQARQLIDELEVSTGAPRPLIGLQALGNPDLLALPLPALATIEVEALFVFADLTRVSLWVTEGGGVECLVRRGRQPAGDTKEIVAAALEGREVGTATRRAQVVTRWQRGHAVLVAEGAGASDAEPLLIQAAAMLSPAFERASLVERDVSAREALAQSAERRLRRLGFDLHDGPVQDVIALGAEITRLSEQLEELELGAPVRRLLDGRIEDLRAYLCTIENDLREFSSSLESPVLVSRPFEEALRGAVWTFTAKSDIQPSVAVAGDVDDLTDTQRITLYRIVQEALSNICDHSQASEASIELRVVETHIALEIRDDGVGFDVDAALTAAARRGHIGLLGMMERVRLIGGDLQIRSQPGGPTRLYVKLARWRPGQAQPRIAVA